MTRVNLSNFVNRLWTCPCKNTISCILPPCRQQSTSFQSAPSLFILPSSVRQQSRVRAPTTSSISHPPFIHPSNLYSTTTQLLHNHFQDIQQPRSNHYSTILRVESKNDSDSTIHIRDSPTPTQPLAKGFVRRWPKAPPRGTLGEYAVSIRSDFRSTASLPPHIRVLCKRSAI